MSWASNRPRCPSSQAPTSAASGGMPATIRTAPRQGENDAGDQMQRYIGNKNYSSWSMRPWLLMTHFGIPFEEVKLRLSFDEGSPFKERLAEIAPTGRVPVLVDDGFSVWESL